MAALGRTSVCLIFGIALISRYTNSIIYLLPCQAPRALCYLRLKTGQLILENWTVNASKVDW